MSKLLDPHICPDCRHVLDAERTCTGCGLRLTGPLAFDLWEHMIQADRLVEGLRAAGAEKVVVPASPMSRMPPMPPMPRPESPGETPSRRPSVRMPGSSVPFVLLSLGAICLLVAAIVFVAVAWSSLGLGAKAAILLGVTALFAATAVVLTRRGLRGAAETFWTIVLAMLTVDLVSAWAADLAGLGGLAERHLVALIGAVLLVVGLGVRAWASTTELKALAVPVLGTGAGTVLLVLGEAWTSDHRIVATALSVPVIVLVAAVIDGIDGIDPKGMRSSAITVASVAVASWAGTMVSGIDRATGATHHTWWHDLPGWPLLVAAGYAAAVSLLRRIPEALRMGAATATLVAAALFVVGPVSEDDPTVVALAGVAVAVALISVSFPRVWSVPAGLLSTLAALVGSVVLLTRPLSSLPGSGTVSRYALDLRVDGADRLTDPWTAAVVAIAVVASLGALVPHAGGARSQAVLGWRAVTAVVLAIGGATALLEHDPRLGIAVLAWAGALILAIGCAAYARTSDVALVAFAHLIAYLAVVDLCLAAPSHLASAVLATAIAATAALGYLRAAPALLLRAALPVLGLVVVVTGGVAAAHWPYLANGGPDAVGITMVLLAATIGVGARFVSRTPTGRVALEAAALGLGLVAVSFPDDSTHVTMVLTLLGSAVALFSLLHTDRDQFSWLGVLLLAIATGVRVEEDLSAPEVYALPAAALLLAAGVLRMRRDPVLGSVRALGSGLTLALGPSLLIALDDPVSLRGVLIGCAGLAALATGTGLRWAAPFVAGAVAVAVLAVRHLGPVAEALPRWISLGAVGVLLLVVGVTWESRRQNAEAASRYLTALR